MTSPNHIVAGTFFTGFWCSFWSINIFSKWEYLVATVICSLLPDIDHPKSPVGMLFYPIAKWLDKTYGHRTVTHSLAFLMVGTILLYMLSVLKIDALENYNFRTFALIFFFAVLSHFILDMVTIQGVPLFYPVKRNPCVIPGNQDYRLVSGKFSTEVTAFLIFIFMNFLCWDLYTKGFWTSYNQIFTTIEHLHYERANSPNFTIATYDFIKNGRLYKGKAPVLNSTTQKCQLLINDSVFHLDYNTPGLVVKSIVASKTNYPYSISSKAFINASLEDLLTFVNGQIVSGTISSSDYFTTHYSGVQKAGNKITLEYDFNVSVVANPSSTPSDKSSLKKQLAIKQQTLALQKQNYDKANSEYRRLNNLRQTLLTKIGNTQDLAERNVLENELQKLNSKLSLTEAPVYIVNIVTLEEIRQLELLIAKPDSVTTQTFTANLSVVNIPTQLKNK